MTKRASWIRRKAPSISIVLLSVVSIGVVHHFFSNATLVTPVTPEVSELEQAFSVSPFTPLPLPAQLDEVIAATRPVLSADIETLSVTGEFQLAKSTLLERAVQAVAAADNVSLALNLGELGELALLQGDLGMAEVYLSESLELYEEYGDELQVAGIHIQIGRLHLYARKRARKASDSYDQLLISRWKISQGRFAETEAVLKEVVKANLELNRFGAAASALKTLYDGYYRDYNILEAQNVGVEAINLYAASGNLHAARSMLTTLKNNGLSRLDEEQITYQLQRHYEDYEASVQAIGAARDYAQLYNQLSSRGDALQAWRFRQQAEQSLSQASKRAQYRRQPDVLVELYRSNSSMDSALVALRKAGDLYGRNGIDEGVDRSQQLRKQIY